MLSGPICRRAHLFSSFCLFGFLSLASASRGTAASLTSPAMPEYRRVSLMRIHSLARFYSQAVAFSSSTRKNKAWLFIDSVFPVKFAAWESVTLCSSSHTHSYNPSSFRYYYGQLRQERVLNSLSELISGVHTHGFKPISIEPHVKDGGVFVLIEYTPSDSEDILSNIQSDLRSYVQSKGGVPSSAGLRRGNIWVVQGQPWREVQLLFPFSAIQPLNVNSGHEQICISSPSCHV